MKALLLAAALLSLSLPSRAAVALSADDAKIRIEDAKGRVAALKAHLGLEPADLDGAPSLLEPIDKLVRVRASSLPEDVKSGAEAPLTEAVVLELAVTKAKGAQASKELKAAVKTLKNPTAAEAAAAKKAAALRAAKKAADDAAAARDEKSEKLREDLARQHEAEHLAPEPAPNTTPAKPIRGPNLRKPAQKPVSP